MVTKSISIYTDGSWSANNPEVVGWGFVVEKSSDGKYEGCTWHGTCDPSVIPMRQIGGELAAVLHAVKYADSRGYTNIIIKHDYNGVANWYHGVWKCKNHNTKVYKEWLTKYVDRNNIDLRFEEISGDNNPADEEARKATGAGSRH